MSENAEKLGQLQLMTFLIFGLEDSNRGYEIIHDKYVCVLPFSARIRTGQP